MKKGKLLRNAFVIALIAWIVMLVKQQINIMQYKEFGSTFILKFEQHEELIRELKKFCEEKNIKNEALVENKILSPQVKPKCLRYFQL